MGGPLPSYISPFVWTCCKSETLLGASDRSFRQFQESFVAFHTKPPPLQPTSSLSITSKHIPEQASAAFQRNNQVRHQPTRQKLCICIVNASWCFVLAFSPHLQPRVFTSSPQTLPAFRFYPFPSAKIYISLFIFSLLTIIFSLFQFSSVPKLTPTTIRPVFIPPTNHQRKYHYQ